MATPCGASRVPALAGGGIPEQSVSTLVELEAGDYAELPVSQNSGGPITLDRNFQRQHFSMAWVAP